MKDTVRFEVKIRGDHTGRLYEGLFAAKTKLSWREMAREDEVRRGILGVNPNEAAEVVQLGASCAAYLAVRVDHKEAPAWWTAKDCNGGLDLEDQNVLVAVHRACVEAVNAEYEAHEKAAVAAQGALKAEAAKLPG